MDPTTLIMVVAFIAIFYFMLIRPQQKRAKETQQMQSSLQPGSRVMTVHGIYATVKHLGQQQAVIEVSPGVEMTIAKQAIGKVIAPAEDEFEYDDDDGDGDYDPEAVVPQAEIPPAQAGAEYQAAEAATDHQADQVAIDQPVEEAPAGTDRPADDASVLDPPTYEPPTLGDTTVDETDQQKK